MWDAGCTEWLRTFSLREIRINGVADDLSSAWNQTKWSGWGPLFCFEKQTKRDSWGSPPLCEIRTAEDLPRCEILSKQDGWGPPLHFEMQTKWGGWGSLFCVRFGLYSVVSESVNYIIHETSPLCEMQMTQGGWGPLLSMRCTMHGTSPLYEIHNAWNLSFLWDAYCTEPDTDDTGWLRASSLLDPGSTGWLWTSPLHETQAARGGWGGPRLCLRCTLHRMCWGPLPSVRLRLNGAAEDFFSMLKREKPPWRERVSPICVANIPNFIYRTKSTHQYCGTLWAKQKKSIYLDLKH